MFIGLSLALTSFFPREGFDLYVIISGDRNNMCFRYWLFFINFQCLLKIRLILWMSSMLCVTNTNLSVCLGFCFLVKASFLPLNLISLMWLTIWFSLYPLCFNLCTSLHVIFWKLVSLELVLRYHCVSPLLIAFMVEGGWYEFA